MFRGSKSESCITLSDCLLNIGSSFWMIVISCFNLDHNLIKLFARETNYKNAKSSQRRHKLGLTCWNTRFSYLYGRCFCAVARAPLPGSSRGVWHSCQGFCLFYLLFYGFASVPTQCRWAPRFLIVFSICAYVLQQTDQLVFTSPDWINLFLKPWI